MDVRVALTGFGNVGQGLAQLLLEHNDEYWLRYGVRFVLVGVADRQGAAVREGGLDLQALLHAKRDQGTVAALDEGQAGLSGAAFLDRSGAQVLVEAASTNFIDAEPGWGYVQEAFSRGMDVVLASKGALVLHFDEVMASAHENGLRVLFAGTVGAPVPVIELSERVLVGIPIQEFEGIVNATTNQILTCMQHGQTYEEGVRSAQEIGIAETDPTLDVDGWDAAAKAVIIGRALFGADLRLEDVSRTGIREVTTDDLTGAVRRGNVIKLIVRVRRDGTGVKASVAPEERPRDDVLGHLDGQQMGAVFKTDLLGQVSSTVELTGGVPTALTVLRDLVNLARDRGWTRPT